MWKNDKIQKIRVSLVLAFDASKMRRKGNSNKKTGESTWRNDSKDKRSQRPKWQQRQRWRADDKDNEDDDDEEDDDEENDAYYYYHFNDDDDDDDHAHDNAN